MFVAAARGVADATAARENVVVFVVVVGNDRVWSMLTDYVACAALIAVSAHACPPHPAAPLHPVHCIVGVAMESSCYPSRGHDRTKHDTAVELARNFTSRVDRPAAFS